MCERFACTPCLFRTTRLTVSTMMILIIEQSPPKRDDCIALPYSFMLAR